MIILPSSVGVVSGAVFDKDALNYFSTAGITDSTAKNQLNNFIKEIKRLGLWNNMVCWPLRSSQNAGTGTTAYSLGGLATYNATLTSPAPTWTSDGLYTDSFTKYATANAQVGDYSNFSLGVIYKLVDVSSNPLFGGRVDGTLCGWGSGGKSTYISADDMRRQIGVDFPETNSGRLTVAGGVASADGTWVMAAGSKSGYVTTGYLKHTAGQYSGTKTTTDLADGTGSTFFILSRQVGYGARGTAQAIVYIFNTSLSESQHYQIYEVVKATLCQGLGLP